MNADRLADRKKMIDRSRRLNENARLARLADKQGVVDPFFDLAYRSTNTFTEDLAVDREDVDRFIARNR
jgi:hypothetical protein